MIAVIFEAIPKAGKEHEYFDIAANLKPMLEKMDGFISVERFRSLSDENKYLSLSFWRDEESVSQWRNLATHRGAQQEGRENVFANYRLRVALVSRDYGMHEREEVPGDSRQFHG